MGWKKGGPFVDTRLGRSVVDIRPSMDCLTESTAGPQLSVTPCQQAAA
jgi:hypothetical protein